MEPRLRRAGRCRRRRNGCRPARPRDGSPPPGASETSPGSRASSRTPPPASQVSTVSAPRYSAVQDARRDAPGRHSQRLGADAREHVAVTGARQHARRNDVHRRRADEARGERGGRPRIDLGRRCVLLHMPVAQQDHLVGHGHGLGLVVGHIEHGDPEPALEVEDLAPHLGAELRVEVRQRLVHQAHRRLGHDRPPQRHALLLAARKLRRAPRQQVPDPQHRRRPLQPELSFGCRPRCAPAART